MNFYKFCWCFRGVIYSLLTNFKLPSYIGKPINITGLRRLKIEKKVRIYPGLRAEIINKKGSISIGENTSIGQNFHVISNDEELRIGKNVVISGNVFISNCDHQFTEKNVHLYDQPLITKHTEIGDNCFIGYGAVILPGTILGKQCVVGANAVVRGIFDDYSVIAGVPGKVIRKIN